MKTTKYRGVVLGLAMALSLMSYIFLLKSQPALFSANCGFQKGEKICLEEEKKSSSMLPDFQIITTIIGTISKFLPAS